MYYTLNIKNYLISNKGVIRGHGRAWYVFCELAFRARLDFRVNEFALGVVLIWRFWNVLRDSVRESMYINFRGVGK